MNTKSKTTILVIVALVIGFFAGVFIGVPIISNSAGLGDVSKVNLFRKSTDSTFVSAFEQKLKNDTVAFNNESAFVQLLSSRMFDFANLVEYTVIAAGDNKQLSEEVNALKNVKELSENALQAAKVAFASLEYLSTGEKTELATGYEQASKNLFVAYLLIDRQVQLGKQFVAAADKYLKGKSAEDVPDLAFVRDLWVNYCGESAWLNGDKLELEYWENKTAIASSKIVDKGIEKLGAGARVPYISIFLHATLWRLNPSIDTRSEYIKEDIKAILR